jgi:hypothetical protein
MYRLRYQFIKNLVLFQIISYSVFTINENKLFAGLDGNYLLSIAKNQFLHGSNFFFENNYLQGIGGNINFPANLRLDPGYIVLKITNFQNLSLGYLTWATLLFVACVFFAQSIGLQPKLIFIFAWMLPMLSLWPTPIRLYPLLAMTPQVATTISLIMVMLSTLILTSRTEMKYFYWELVVFSACLIYFILTAPMNIFFVIPVIAMALIARTSIFRTRRMLLSSVIVYVAPTLLFMILGAFHFTYGLFNYTGFNVYDNLFPSALATNLNRSSIFWGPSFFGVSTGIAFLFLITIGIQKMRNFSGENIILKMITRLTIISVFFLLAINFLTYVFKISTAKFPSPAYFEVFLWPVLVLAIGFAINFLLDSLGNLSYLNLSGIKIILIISLLGSTILTVNNEEQRNYKESDPISEMLTREFNNAPPEFQGRVATLTGTRLQGSVSWIELFSNDRNNFAEFGTDFRTYKLWNARIPTLAEYSPTLSPAYFNFTRKNFEKPGDKQIRNIMTLRKFDQKNLELIGVKWVISDKNIDGLPVVAEARNNDVDLRLYELPNPNLGSFTNTEVFINTNTIERATAIFSGSVVALNRGDNVKFTQVRLSSMNFSELSVQGNGYTFRGKSDGQSLAILPIEYSHCFVAENLNLGKENEFQLKSYDGLLLGVLFRGDINVALKYKNGPFTNSKCRNLDADLYKSIKNLV